MKYLADLLTASRFALAVVIMVSMLHAYWLLAIACFAIAAITDALDGMCARRWPYTPQEASRLPWRRIDPRVLDNAADSLLMALAALALALTFPWWWIVIAVIYGVGFVLFMGITLYVNKGEPRKAERADVTLGWWYTLGLYVVFVQLGALAGLLYVSILALAVATILLFVFKREHFYSRPLTYQLALQRKR